MIVDIQLADTRVRRSADASVASGIAGEFWTL